jgi:hypothetical protein
MFFKKGLRESSLICKLAMKNPRTFEEATLNTRDTKKDKEPGHSDQPSTSKSNDKNRKSDRSMANVERPCHNKEYWPRLGEFEGFLDQICIFHPQRKHKTRDCD